MNSFSGFSGLFKEIQGHIQGLISINYINYAHEDKIELKTECNTKLCDTCFSYNLDSVDSFPGLFLQFRIIIKVRLAQCM